MFLQSIKKTIATNKLFIFSYHLLLLVGLYPLWQWDKLAITLAINKYHHLILDYFFYGITQLGHTMTFFLWIVVLIKLKVSYRKLAIVLVSFGSMSVIVQGLKRLCFTTCYRPAKYIQYIEKPLSLYVFKYVDLLMDLSFPSGHAATIFTMVFLLQLFARRKSIGLGMSLLFTACLVAFSRVYLCQHFYVDVYIGSWIGGWAAFFTYAYLYDRPIPKIWLTLLPKGVQKKFL